MASNYPNALDSFTDPLSTSPLNSPSHSTLHADVNDAIEKIEAYVPRRNFLYNGAMQVHQRGTSTASITTSGYYTADRYATSIVTLGSWTQSVENDAPTGSGFRKSLKMTCTTADASPAAGDYLVIQQGLEGQDCQSIGKGTSSAQQLTLSFWVKSNRTGTYIVQLEDSDNNRRVSASYPVVASATWEYKTITFPADTTGALDNDNAKSLAVNWWLGAGSNFSSGTLATTWASAVSANFAVGQVNLAGTVNNYWQVTGVQLNLGAVAAPFEFKDYGRDLRECQRYYETSFPTGIAPQTAYATGRLSQTAFTVGAQSYSTSVFYKVNKRASINAITVFNPVVASNTGQWYTAAGGTNTSTAIEQQSDSMFHLVNANANYGLVQFHWVSSAEL